MSIQLFIGPMFSEKTTTMLSMINKCRLSGKNCLIIKHTSDVRYSHDDTIITHSGLTHSNNVISVNSLRDVSNADNFDVIGIDEGQFFDDIIMYANLWANKGKSVIIAALDGDTKQKEFGAICALIPYCEGVTKLYGVCMMCKSVASSFSKRRYKDSAGNIVEIGGNDKYLTVCRKCYIREEDGST